MGVRVLRGEGGGAARLLWRGRRRKAEEAAAQLERGKRVRDDRRARGVSDTGRRERGAAATGLMARGLGRLSGPCAVAGWGRPG